MKERTSREKTLYRYHMALERGDFATVAAILSQAEQDATLARLLLELNAALEAEADGFLSPQPVPRANHSTNGQRHPSAPAKEEISMTVYETTHPGRTLPVGRSSARPFERKPALTLIAAVIAVVLFGVALLSSGLPISFDGAAGGPVGGASGPDGLPGAALQEASATPTATFTPTPVPTSSPTLLPTVVGPQADPLILTATGVVEQATLMAGGAFASPMVVTATPILVPFGTVEMGVVDVIPLMPTVVPPSVEFSASGGITMGGWPGLTILPVGSTASFGLTAGSVTTFQITAEEAGALVITATSLDFTPRLLVVALDDPDLEIRRNLDSQSPPTVTVPVSEGDRVLIFVYSVDREATGQFLINAHMG